MANYQIGNNPSGDRNELKAPYDFRPFEAMYPEWEKQFFWSDGGGAGEYCYLPGRPSSLYGATDMLFCRAITGILKESTTEEDRLHWAGVINRFQDPGTGWYKKRYTRTHPREHGTAYALAALKLLGQEPAHPQSWIDELNRGNGMTRARTRFLRRVPWSIIWMGSHILAGTAAIMMMEERAGAAFLDWYFAWLDAKVAPTSGFWERGLLHRLGILPGGGLHDMGGAFHMFFLYRAAGRDWRYPEKVIDATLSLQGENGFWDGEKSYCNDQDGIYCLPRSNEIIEGQRGRGYREDEIRTAVERYLASASDLLNDRERLFTRYANSHDLPGALCAIAECQKYYPELVRTLRPWRQTLDGPALYI